MTEVREIARRQARIRMNTCYQEMRYKVSLGHKIVYSEYIKYSNGNAKIGKEDDIVLLINFIYFYFNYSYLK